ncbi:hypothetical protein CLU81_3662 [Flavobacterium sp. 9]|nr:hypothetical protein CLU81_3662 [Flavobacterium sp. 9]
MVTTARSKKLEKSIFFIIYFVIIYSTLAVILPFFIMSWSWGEKLNIFQNSIIYFFSKPFNPTKSLFFILLNGFFWGIIFSLCLFIIYLFKNKSKLT